FVISLSVFRKIIQRSCLEATLAPDPKEPTTDAPIPVPDFRRHLRRRRLHDSIRQLDSSCAQRPQRTAGRDEETGFEHRRYRTEPVELARRRHRAWRRAPAVKEARGR